MKHVITRVGTRSTLVVAALALLAALPAPFASAYPLDDLGPDTATAPSIESDHALPVARKLLSPRELREPHHDHPGIDIDLRIGTPVMAIRPGRVRMILNDGGCGSGIVVDGADGFTYTYCHASKVRVAPREKLSAGELIMSSGISGSAENAHLHLEIEDAKGRLVCPQPILLAVWHGRTMSAHRAPYRGCTD